MLRKQSILLIGFTLLMLLLSGCHKTASKAPEILEEPVKTTPIQIVTEVPGFVTPIPEEPAVEGNDQAPDEEGAVVEPTDEPAPPIAVPTVTRPTEYTLQPGEFPFCIARRFDVNPGDLLNLNNIGANELVAPGTTLKIPQTGSWEGERSLKPHPTTFTVSAGDTIYTIACSFGPVTPEAIIAVNQLEKPYSLSSGQILEIP